MLAKETNKQKKAQSLTLKVPPCIIKVILDEGGVMVV